jgi:hypothetical protein
MRAGRLAFCDAIFVLEPQLLWQRLQKESGRDAHAALRAISLLLTYGKPDLAAAVFDRAEGLPAKTHDACAAFFKRLENDGGWRQRLHHRVDAWVQKV